MHAVRGRAVVGFGDCVRRQGDGFAGNRQRAGGIARARHRVIAGVGAAQCRNLLVVATHRRAGGWGFHGAGTGLIRRYRAGQVVATHHAVQSR